MLTTKPLRHSASPRAKTQLKPGPLCEQHGFGLGVCCVGLVLQCYKYETNQTCKREALTNRGCGRQQRGPVGTRLGGLLPPPPRPLVLCCCRCCCSHHHEGRTVVVGRRLRLLPPRARTLHHRAAIHRASSQRAVLTTLAVLPSCKSHLPAVCDASETRTRICPPPFMKRS
jgi:hypothetical protein